MQYSSWVAHHLSQLCPDPFGFDLDRFLPEREAALVARRLHPVRRLLEDAPRIVTTPTLGPKGGRAS